MPALHALAQLWQFEADAKRHPVPLVHRLAQQSAWNHCLDRAVSFLGFDLLQSAWHALHQGTQPLLARHALRGVRMHE